MVWSLRGQEIFGQLVHLIPLSGARHSNGVDERKEHAHFIGDRFHDAASRRSIPTLFNSFKGCSAYRAFLSAIQ
ncbi:hypothetical protein H6G96_21785 [Nostoc sp. FACHB-892]|uniref:hypothetical protein n=1 Tax=Nostoc sp. FACHB-892 TaxID=2692843 RepID=UPI0016871F82|nr:hypothetical protein [Nostoc sp. FACHB-892]MBD2728881.1 hypothetical protein [Nostoc sp. FACHB-892]